MNVQTVSVLNTAFGTWLSPTQRVAAFVRSTGAHQHDPSYVRERLVATLAAGLARCTSGRGDVIVVLRGHAENVTDNTMLASIAAGVMVVGEGDPLTDADAPVFTWTATGSKWLVDEANVTFARLKLDLSGANGVVKAIEVTAAGAKFLGNYIVVASGAALKATIALEVGTAAHRFRFEDNEIRGTATHNITDGIKIVGATPATDVRIRNNRVIASATAGNGFVNVTVACLNLDISGNTFYNTHTASTACIAFANVAADGVCERNSLYTINDGVAAAQGIVVAGSNCLVKFNQNYSCDEKAKSGVLTPAAVAT